MLYNSFRVLMIITSVMGILNMIVQSSYEYIFFPITIIIWGIFSFFDENDRRNRYNSYESTYTPYAQSNVYKGTYTYSNTIYKKLLPKVKRSVKVTIDSVN